MKKILAPILLWLGCKDLSLMLYGLKHLNFKLFFDGIFFGKYRYQIRSIGDIEFATKYKKYFGNERYKKALIKGLDKESVDTVNQVEKNIKWILKEDDTPYIKKSDFGIYDSETKIEKYVEKYTKDIFLPIDHKESSVFYYKHGINLIKDLKEFLKGKDIIDCGAFIGDSAMMFSKELGFVDGGGILGKIRCLEPEPTNHELLKETIKHNKKEGKIIPVRLGVGNKKETLYINFDGSASTVGDKKDTSAAIEVDTIDNIVKDYKINPGMIKRDIEGLEYNSVLGCEETIKKYKPILLISIYHNGRDFYEIKPLIESWNLGYKFMIRHLCTGLFAETMLICY